MQGAALYKLKAKLKISLYGNLLIQIQVLEVLIFSLSQ